MTLSIQACSPEHELAVELLRELSLELARRTGSDGTANFKHQDVAHPRSIFLIAMQDGEAVGCGALRPLDDHVAEIKRMYTRHHRQGVGGALLAELERRALDFGYRAVWLETRKVNAQAVEFYTGKGYRVRENYGPYVGRDEAVCFEKRLSASTPASTDASSASSAD